MSDPLDIIKQIIPSAELIIQAQKEFTDRLGEYQRKWSETEITGYSPGKEVAITFCSTVTRRVVISLEVDTNNKTLVEMLVMAAMNDAIKLYQAGYDAHDKDCAKLHEEVYNKYEELAAKGQQISEDSNPTGDNVLNFINIVNNRKNRDLKKD